MTQRCIAGGIWSKTISPKSRSSAPSPRDTTRQSKASAPTSTLPLRSSPQGKCQQTLARERVVSPFPACRVRAHLKACDAVPAAPFSHLSRLALVPSPDVDFIDLSGALQLRDGSACHQPLAEVLGHRRHVRGVQAQFLRDLPVGEVQPHQVEAQNPHAQWLMVPAQHRAGQIVEASMARLAQVALPVPLSFVMAMADDHGIVAVRAAHASWPTMLTHKLKTLGLVQQPREIDHLRYRHACAASQTTRSRLHPIRSETWLQRYPSRATTPEPNKSLRQTTGLIC